jgi:nucleotidyltransferase/DNA polymerase involved in DNA repair
MPALRTVLHVDMDAFYTSIEQRDRPELRGRPVVVGADPKQGRGRGVVAAASYEVRAFGVRSAMPIGKAFRLCPQAVFLPPDMRKYGEVSRRIMAIFREFTDLVEPLSIDEAFLDVSGSRARFGDGRQIALAIKQKVRDRERLTASVGIATNKFLAKLASDLQKPDGLVEVPPGQEAEFLRDLPLERLWGVGPKTAEALRRLGLRTIGEIARLPEGELAGRFGKHGAHLYQLSRGMDDRPVEPERDPKSIGQETTFDEDTADPEVIRRTLLELAVEVARRLRAGEVLARRVTLKFRDERFVTVTRARTLARPTDDGRLIFETALALLDRVPLSGVKVRLLGISAGALEPAAAAARQLDLFDPGGERRGQLDRTADALRERFGDGAVGPASLLKRAP